MTDKPNPAVRVAACVEAAGIPMLDTWSRLIAINRIDLAAFKRLFVMHDEGRLYGHMSAEGNALMAGLIAERLLTGAALSGVPPGNVE